jgi:hypothetical protein
MGLRPPDPRETYVLEVSIGEVVPGWYRRATRRLEGVDDDLDLHRIRWMLVFSLGTWVPLVALAALGGVLDFQPRFAALIADLPTHARLLLAIPLLIDAAKRADGAVSSTRLMSMERLSAPEDVERMKQAQAAFERARHSYVLRVATAALAVAAGFRYAYVSVSNPVLSWLHPRSDEWLSGAGLWYCAVCVPVFIYLLIRVAWRWASWVLLLIRTSRLRLTIVPSHADKAGGLGIVGLMPLYFASAIAAVSAVMGMTWLKKVLFEGAQAQHFARPAAGLLLLMLLLFFSPPLVFVRQLSTLKLKAAHDFAELVFRTNRVFERRWLRPDSDPQAMLDQGEASAVADLGTVYSQVERMWVFPFRMSALIAVVAAVVIPLLPVIIAQVGVHELLKQLLGALV